MRGDVPLSLLGASPCHGHIKRRKVRTVLRLAPTSLMVSTRREAQRHAAAAPKKFCQKQHKQQRRPKKIQTKLCGRVTRASSRRRWRRSLSLTPEPHEHCCHRPAGVSWRAVAKQTPLPSLPNLLVRFPSCLFSSVFL